MGFLGANQGKFDGGLWRAARRIAQHAWGRRAHEYTFRMFHLERGECKELDFVVVVVQEIQSLGGDAVDAEAKRCGKSPSNWQRNFIPTLIFAVSTSNRCALIVLGST